MPAIVGRAPDRKTTYPWLMAEEVKRARRRGYTRLSSKNQATIPVAALEQAGLRPGDELKVEADGPGRVVLTRCENRFDKYAGAFPGVFPPGFLEELRAEWDS